MDVISPNSALPFVRKVSLPVFLILAVLAGGLALSAQTASPAAALEAQTGLPEVPRVDTPRFIGGTVTDQTVVGNRVIVVGTFEQVQDNDGTLTDQAYYAAYDIDTGALDLDASPTFNKPVRAVEPDGHGGVIVGGEFINIDGFWHLRIARLDAAGQLDRSFRASASAKVTELAVKNDRVYAGGAFLSPARGLAAYVLSDGSVDPNFNFPLAGPAGRGGELAVKGLGFSGDDLVVVHSGLLVAGQSRVGAAIIDTTPVAAPTLRAWQTNFYKDNTTDVGGALAITNGAVSPDGSYFVVVSSGGDRPLQGRDAAVRFPVAGSADVQPDWISRHFDSLFGVGISDRAVFIGGHFQYQEAPGSTDPYPGDPNTNYGTGPRGDGPFVLGNEVVAREQIGALDPTTGKSLDWNPGAGADIGVESLVVVERGLLVGQDGDRLGGKDIGRHGFFDINNDPGVGLELGSSFDSHFTGQTVEPGPVTLSGLATDGDSGVQRLQLAIRHTDSGQYVQADGSLGAWTGINADLATPGTNETAWSATVDLLAPGTYRIQARTFTTDGRKDLSPPHLELNVQADAVPFVGDVSIQVGTAGVVTATGTVTDDLGVRSVSVRVEDRDSGDFLQADGSFAAAEHRFDVELPVADASEVEWATTITVPRDGRFTLEASATDTTGQDDGRFVYKHFIVASNDVPPTVSFPAGNSEVEADQPFFLSPVFEDDFGLATATVLITDVSDGSGPRPDGSFGIPPAIIPILGAADEVFFAPEVAIEALPAGTYSVTFSVEDAVGQTDTASAILEVGPIGDTRPARSITTPRTNLVAPQELVVEGQARDDVGVDAVIVYLRDVDAASWVDLAGNRVTEPVAHSATLAVPGGTSTNFTFSWLADDASTYELRPVAIDAFGQTSGSGASTYTYNPENTAPELTVLAPTDGQVFSDGVIAVNGRALDDAEIMQVRIRIRREADGRWLRSNGRFGNPQWLSAILSNPGREATNFTFFSRDLAAGDYTVQIQAIDDTNQRTTTSIPVVVGTLEPEPELSNVALGQPATQSSTAFGGAASRAVDGNLNGRYRNGSITHTAQSNQPWWQVDLGASSDVATIEIYNRADSCCAQRLNNVVVFVSATDMSGRSIDELEADPAVASYSIDGQLARHTVIDIGATGQHVRVQLRGSNGTLSLAEVIVNGTQ